MRANFQIHVAEAQHSVRSITSVLRSKNQGQAEMTVAPYLFLHPVTQIWRRLMTDKELRHLSRSELLELLIAQRAENDQLKTTTAPPRWIPAAPQSAASPTNKLLEKLYSGSGPCLTSEH